MLLRISILIPLIAPLVKIEPAESKTFAIIEPADKKFESLHYLQHLHYRFLPKNEFKFLTCWIIISLA